MKNKFSIYVFGGICILLGTFLSPILFSGYKNLDPPIIAENQSPPVKDSPSKAQAVSLENAFQDVFDQVSPSVVSIATEKTVKLRMNPMEPFFDHYGYSYKGQGGEQKQRGLGSGIILNQEGYILTNDHVVSKWDKLTVRLKNKKTFEAKLIGTDETLDLALLKISPSSELKPVVLGDSNRVRVGNWSIAIGAPHGFEQSFTVGVVSAIARSKIDQSGLGYIQTDAAINQGNSGGPLLNIHGEVIGINRMIVSPSGGSIGIGFAIPINDAKRIIEELKSTGKVKHPWIGIGFTPISEEAAKNLKLKEAKGALVTKIFEGSPAEKAGLMINDVILKADSTEIETGEDLKDYILNIPIGRKIELKVFRKGSVISINLVTAENPNKAR
jgi:serine protease Do